MSDLTHRLHGVDDALEFILLVVLGTDGSHLLELPLLDSHHHLSLLLLQDPLLLIPLTLETQLMLLVLAQ